MANTERLSAWDKVEAAARALYDELEKAATDPSWQDGDMDDWGDVHDALYRRPSPSIEHRDAMSDRGHK